MDKLKIAFWSFYENNCRNMKMFYEKDHEIAEGIFKKWNTLYNECVKVGIDIVSLDTVRDFDEVDFFVFVDFPVLSNLIVKKALKTHKPKILIIEEGPLIHPNNWKIDNHLMFDYIFTWNDEFVDNIKYFKFNLHFVDKMTSDISFREKMCVLIARNKKAYGKSELYTLRRNLIRFFEKKHPEDFDLFGEGWDLFYFPSNFPILKLFNGTKLFWFRSKIREKFPSWKGPLKNKIDILKKYRFSITFENSFGPKGYISEKIWDSFTAGTIPVYLGAPNICNSIPKNCFIDFRDFKSFEELYDYMSNMKEKEYFKFLNNINSFLNDQLNGGVFSDQYFVKSFIDLVRTANNNNMESTSTFKNG